MKTLQDIELFMTVSKTATCHHSPPPDDAQELIMNGRSDGGQVMPLDSS